MTRLLEQTVSIDGRFTNLSRMTGGSTGHFSALLSATDGATNRQIALKCLLPMFGGGYRDESFEREVLLLQELRGQSDIIQLVAPRAEFIQILHSDHGIEIPVTFSYFALELAKTDLGTIIANNTWNAEQLLIGFRSMCRGVQRLHSQLIAHRDLKPPNFLVMDDDTVRLSDLGTARRLDGLTPSLAVYTGPPGDVRYAAPELLAILHDAVPSVAFKADFFSLGAILFEMFAGTILGTRIYDSAFVADLAQAMLHVKPGQRQYVFDQLITAISDARPIPSVSTFGTGVPNSIRRPIDELVRALAALDYRKRLCDFSRVFNRINMCLLILRNEEKYQRWRAEKRRQREAAGLVVIRSVL